MNNKLTVPMQTIKMIYKNQEITPDEFDASKHTVYNLIPMYRSQDGRWFTVPVDYADPNQITDNDEIARWAAQWGI